MSWKDLPYWLKGGIIGACIGVLLIPLQIIFFWFSWQQHLLVLFMGFILGILISVLFRKMPGPYWLRGGIIGLIFGFIGTYLSVFLIALPEAIREDDYLFFFDIEGHGMIFVFVIIPSTIILVILGIIIGLIMGRIKSRGEK